MIYSAVESSEFDLIGYRKSDKEFKRTNDLMRLIPIGGTTSIDIGARDGHFSKLLANNFQNVVALDLEKPKFQIEGVKCIQGNASKLEFADRSFDLVFCAEVIEHIPSPDLEKACLEMVRVSKEYILIGVPFEQDIRVGRTSCKSCGKINPPWGHVNRFDLARLRKLFPGLVPAEISYVEKTRRSTNKFSTWLLDLASNPYGTYDQEESCIHCNKKLLPPLKITFFKKC